MVSPGHVKRRENWTDVETWALIEIIKQSKHCKNGKFKPEICKNGKFKPEIYSATSFEELASLLNSEKKGPKRIGEQIKSKWYNELKDIWESSTKAGLLLLA